MKTWILKIQEATGSVSDPIYTPINDGQNTAELMFKKKIIIIIWLYFVLHRELEISSQKGLGEMRF